jgi:CheY-like chemotaxis protein
MRKKTVLVIEDDEMNMKLVRTLLKLGDFEVLEANNAEKGIGLAREHRPDLILMDLQLPGMDGLHAAGIIREDAAIKDLPIVALTAFAMRGDYEKALDAGCVGYLTKPIDTRGFLDTISEFMKSDPEENNQAGNILGKQDLPST